MQIKDYQQELPRISLERQLLLYRMGYSIVVAKDQKHGCRNRVARMSFSVYSARQVAWVVGL